MIAPEKCQLCGLNPRLKANKGRQIYVCDSCECLVCSECSEDGSSKEFGFSNPVLCVPCHREREELKAEQAGLR